MPRYVSLPRTSWVTIADRAGVVQTLEGAVRHEAGEAIVTGQQGEQWPVARAVFESKYRPVGGQTAGHSGYYERVEEEVDAIESAFECSIKVQGGTLKAHPGDWIVTYPDGSRSVVRADLFEGLYRPDACGFIRRIAQELDASAFQPRLRQGLREDLEALALVSGKRNPALAVFVAARCLERIVNAADDPTSRVQRTVQQRVDVLQMTGGMTSGEAAAAHNLRRLGNQVRHLDDALTDQDEPFVQSLLCGVLGWAIGWSERGASDTAGADARRKRTEAAAPVPEVITLMQARSASDCVASFAAILGRVHANGEFLLLYAIERSLDFGAFDVANRMLASVRGESGIRSRRCLQLRILAASRMGDLRLARDLIEKRLDHELRNADDRLFEESQGIKGGVYKRCWKASGSQDDLARAHQAYVAAWSRGGTFYSGINCAATLAWLGRSAEARTIAERIKGELGMRIEELPPTDRMIQDAPWLYATYAEACLLAGAQDEFAKLVPRIELALSGAQSGVWKSFEDQLALHQAHGFAMPKAAPGNADLRGDIAAKVATLPHLEDKSSGASGQ